MLKVCQEEQSSSARPEIKDPLTDVSEYDTILWGTPIWYGHIPNIVMTQLEKLNLNGKTIYPFNTHAGSGVGNTVTNIKQYATRANVKDGFPLLGTYVKNNNNDDEEEEENIPTFASSEFIFKNKYFLILTLLCLM